MGDDFYPPCEGIQNIWCIQETAEYCQSKLCDNWTISSNIETLKEDGISEPRLLFLQRNKRKQCIRIVVTETTTWAKCQQQLADTMVGKEIGNLLFNGLSSVLGFCSCCLFSKDRQQIHRKGKKVCKNMKKSELVVVVI